MSEDENHFRAPVSDAYRRKTPFRQLLEHMGKVRKCIDMLGDELFRYYQGNYEGISELANKVSQIEHEADLIKSNLRNHLPSSLFMPVDKSNFMCTLHEQDAILDHADNLVKMLDMRHTKIPDGLQEDFIDHARVVLKTVEAMEEAVENMKDLVETSFIKRERNQTKKLIYKVHKFEDEADEKKHDITEGIYRMEKKLDPMDEYHLLKIADWVDDIADHAENVAEWLRAMIAK
ncbi:MAG: TIGR00153 family protein [Candidatus Thermoplasmatota archaeon]